MVRMRPITQTRTKDSFRKRNQSGDFMGLKNRKAFAQDLIASIEDCITGFFSGFR